MKLPAASLSRRQLLTGAAAAGACLGIGGPAHANGKAQQIARHFSSVKTMSGEFLQFSPTGEQTSGKFYLQRPGRIRFNYDSPSPIRVIADGKSVVVNNAKLKTWDLYPLSQTPLKLLLQRRIDIGGGRLKSIKEDPDLTTIVLGDKKAFGNANITMMFDPKSYELRQWMITDKQGKETTVMLFNVQKGQPLDKSLFAIDYKQVRKKEGYDR